MRITFVTPYAGLAGGMRVIAIYADRLQRMGHKVFVISRPPRVRLRSQVKSLLLGRGLIGRRCEPSYLDGIDVEHRVLESIRPVSASDVPDADVVLATYYTTAPGVMQLPPSKGAKAIFIQNYEVTEGKVNAVLDSSWRMPMHKITISKWLVELARDKFGDTDVSLIPNSVDMLQFHAAPRGKSQRPTVGFLYNTFSLKGCGTALTALQRVMESIPDLKVVAFGAEHPRARYPLPRGTEFHYRPAQAKLREIYAQCDVWMCGSNVEGFHLPPLEAMACRCPVVSTRVGGPADIVVEGENGHLVDVRDVDALAAQVIRVLRLNDGEWRRMSNAALGTAEGFTWDEAAEMFEEALEVAIDKNGGKRSTDSRPVEPLWEAFPAVHTHG